MTTRTRVLVLPGLAAGDRSTQAIRTSLATRGHHAHGWQLGRNSGPNEQTVPLLIKRLTELFERDREPVALVGWSMGGLYAHWLARAVPHFIHSVTTLGSPLRMQGSPAEVLRVPTTSVYSRRDRIVPWRSSRIDETARRHENVEVRSTHLTLGFDPAVLYLINDRISQVPSDWQPFVAPALLRTAFPRREPSSET